MIKKGEWEAAYRDLVAEGRARVEPPTDEEILALSSGDLSEERAASIRERLAYYPELARALAVEFPFPYEGKPGDPDYLSDEDMAEDWASLQARIKGATVAPAPVSIASRAASPPSLRATGGSGALSGHSSLTKAAALVAVVASGLFVWSLFNSQRREKELTDPRINIDVTRLKLTPGGLRGPEEPANAPPSGNTDLLLVPALVNKPAYKDYRAVLLDVNADTPAVIWDKKGLRREEDDTFRILLRREFLRPGNYKLNIYGLPEEDLLATYAIRLPAR